MRYCRFTLQGQPVYGAVEDRDRELWITKVIPPPEEDLAARLALMADEPAGIVVSEWTAQEFEPIPIYDAILLPPVTPSKIIGVGRNYRDHAAELGNDPPAEPLLFFKPPSSLLGHGGVVRMPLLSERVDFEGELAIVVGKRMSKVKPGDDWRRMVRGYTLANDVTARDLQKKDAQWTRAKGFDTFCPVGPIVSNEVDPVAGVTLEARVNGRLRQRGSTTDFIFGIPELLVYITAAITLEPGDLVLTGTPAGVAPLVAGDHVAITVDGLGTLGNSF